MATFGIGRNLKFPKANHKIQNIKDLAFFNTRKVIHFVLFS